MGIRRIFANRKRKRIDHIWPISKTSKEKPVNWQGWPEEKQFAFIITHDVEGQKGLNRVRQLAELEMKHGFRSSFNFIPEGEYTVPLELINWLKDNGFEVGVHDLHHDGKLYKSRAHFAKSAKKINGHLKNWDAVGYRSGFMLHNLEWQHDLDVLYDASTFDTDPFEPQPDPANTIFPFWVEKRQTEDENGDSDPNQNSQSNRNGYVELPYTLAQDSTVYLVFREKTSDIWKRKLEWLASQKSMALVNVHPDYMNFGNDKVKADEFPASIYSEFLEHVSNQYRNQYWHAIPRKIASWYKKDLTSRGVDPDKKRSERIVRSEKLRGKRAIVFLFSYYPGDPRPRRAAEAMAGAGIEVDLICLRGSDSEPKEETINGVNVTRVSIKKRRDGKLAYIWQYTAFFFACATRASLRLVSKRYHIVHAHNMPDFLVLAGAIPKLLGAKCILDLHDPMPELMMGIYGMREKSIFVRFLKFVEKVSIGFSNLSITPNIAFKKLFVERSCRSEKMQIVMNSPEQRIFDPDKYGISNTEDAKSFRIMHHGSIVHRHGVDLLVRAVAKVKESVPNATLEIFGSHTDFLDTVFDVANEVGISDSLIYHGGKKQNIIAEEIRRCDVGIVPNRRSAFTEVNFPTRLFEYLSMGCPVIAPSTRGIRDYFEDEEIIYFEPDSIDSLAQKIIWVYHNRPDAQKIVERGKSVYRNHLWDKERSRLLDSVTSLFK